jgi:uroporphyrinogen-III synthase
LCRAIEAAGEAGPLLHLHGQDRRGDVAETLSARGISTVGVVVYDQDPQTLTAEAATLLSLDQPVLAPVLSPRTARLLSAERARLALNAPLRILALSPAVAEAMVLHPGDRIAISERPDVGALMDAMEPMLRDGA